MSKYSRYQSVISRNADENIGEDHWLKQFQKSLEKGAVQPKAQESFQDQINSIMNGSKSKYPSVAAAVEDMKERSGLKAYLDKIKISSEMAIKKAADEQNAIDKKIPIAPIVVPIVIKKCPNIKNTLENHINDTSGNNSIPAIIEKIKSIHKSDVSDEKDWDDDNLVKFISSLNLKKKKDSHQANDYEGNLGKRDDMNNSEIDKENTDAFSGLNPVKF